MNSDKDVWPTPLRVGSASDARMKRAYFANPETNQFGRGCSVLVVVWPMLIAACGGSSSAASGAATAAETAPVASAPAQSAQTAERAVSRSSKLGVSALGRLEPKGGVRRIGVPSTPYAINGAIVEEIAVEEGQDVVAGQVLAVTESAKVLAAIADEFAAEVTLAEKQSVATRGVAESRCVLAEVTSREAKRVGRLLGEGVVSEDLEDRAQSDAIALAADCRAARADVAIALAKIEAAKAKVARARAEAERAVVRAPADGRILQVNAHRGEIVGPAGLVEFGRVHLMYAIAEVYEEDIGRVRVGQRASVSSPALAQELKGVVERIRNKVEKQDQLNTDPAARRDARVVEVEVLLDRPELAAALTNLQVEVVIAP